MAFDRLLARMFERSQPSREGWVLKGGYVFEMRFHQARSTKDFDLTIGATEASSADRPLRERLQYAAAVPLPDFFTLIVGEAMAELNQAPEGGARFPVTRGSMVEHLPDSTSTSVSGMTSSMADMPPGGGFDLNLRLHGASKHQVVADVDDVAREWSRRGTERLCRAAGCPAASD